MCCLKALLRLTVVRVRGTSIEVERTAQSVNYNVFKLGFRQSSYVFAHSIDDLEVAKI